MTDKLPTTLVVADLLRALLAQKLDLNPAAIDERERFNRYGLDSAGARAFIQSVSQRLGRKLAATVAWDHPTLASLAAHLAGESTARTKRPIGPLAADEPIAVVGLSCRFPGSSDPPSFWRMLMDGIDAIREVPPDRWPIDRLYDPDPATPGRMSTRWGGFLNGIDQFDAAFFGISPREAAQMDPQQRLALELAWEAFEDAGWRPSAYAGRRAGVFLGAMWSDYQRLLERSDDIAQHTATGQDTSIISARISYALGLEGPSLTVNTACSSALVAVHLACQSLRSGESQVALAGGVHLVLAPQSTIAMTKFGAMSPDGRCKAFDARANGYVRGEGGGLVALKPLAQARADGDQIYATILGSAVNNDGPSNGLTAPNPDAQRGMLSDALAAAGIAPDTVDYVEAHGTGTSLGDPIEAGALGSELGRGRGPTNRLRIGSVKTNIGHLEAAAGAAGLIKTVLALYERRLPPSLHYQRPSPHIAFADLGLEVQASAEDWPIRDHAPTAGVSSFGFGGTNCHVVLRAEDLAADADTGGTVFVFAGNGGVWPGMGRELLVHDAAFAELVDRLDGHLAGLNCNWRLRDILGDGALAARIEEPAFAQPALFAWQLGIVERLRSQGIAPAAVLGHSVGEIAAAVVAGALDEVEGLRIVVERSRLQAELAGMGTMALALADPATVAPALSGDVVIAGRNGPRATLLSGSPSQLDLVLQRVEALGVTALPVRVPVAYHGPQMEPLRVRLEASLNKLRPQSTCIVLISTVTGEPIAGEDLDAAYWGRNLREPVAFHEGVLAAGALGFRRFVEIAPHTLLAGLVAQTLPQAQVLPLMRRGDDDVAAVAALAGRIGRQRSGSRRRHLLVLSARSQAALWALADRWAERLPADFANLCHTALVGRERFSWRLALHAADGHEAKTRLKARDVLWAEVPANRQHPLLDAVQASDESIDNYLSRAATAFVQGDEIDGLAFDADEPWRTVAAPTYPFERSRHWLVSREQDRIDPAWLMQVAFLPGPAPLIAWPTIRPTAGPVDLGRTQALDALATRYALAALHALQPGQVSPRHAALVALLAKWHPVAELPDPGEGPDLRLLHRLGPKLADVLRGAADPLEVLFPGGNFAEAALLYGQAPLFERPAQELARTVRAWADGLNRPVRILEIGAGTGGLTGHLLHALAGIELDYLYTDVSPAFLAWGCRQFGTIPGFRTGLIDLEASNGAAETYDLVVAANAVHATHDIKASTAAAAAWLAPGGYLALVELVHAPRWIDLVFGTTDGWWRFVEDPRRPNHALLDERTWRDLFAEIGLQAIQVGSDGDSHGLIIGQQPRGRSFQLKGDGNLATRLRGALPSCQPVTDVVLVPAREDAAEQVQALLSVDPALRFWLVRRPGPEHAAMGGAHAALAIDQPDRIATSIEMLDEEQASFETLVEELLGEGLEDRVRIAYGQRSVARLTTFQGATAPSTQVRSDRLYVIVGGLGMLGRAFAAWLVEQGARHLLLVGRTAKDPQDLALLRRAGADVRVVALDLCSEDAEQNLAALIDRPVAGIIHAAGSANGTAGDLIDQKLRIADVLVQVARYHEPDFMIVLTSAAGVWGIRDNVGYAAANAALDGWAAAQRGEGLHVTSVALGRLAERGLLLQKDDAALEDAGLLALPLSTVCRAALDAAAAGQAQIVLAHVDWTRFIGTLEARRRHPLFDLLRPSPLSARPALPAAFPDRQPIEDGGLRKIIADILGFADPARVDPRRGLFEQGLDSLLALTLRRRLEERTGAAVPTAVLFSHPTVEQLERWLDGSAGGRQVGTLPRAGVDQVAIIGIGCRFPGGIHGPDAFADAIWNGADLIGDVPANRWSNDEWHDPNPGRPGRITSRFGGFLDDVDQFDPAFFGISPREAIQMDPQQRLLLETAWEALEHSVIAPDRLAGTRTAIYVGATGSDYAALARKAGIDTLDGHTLTGQPSNTLAGRLAHVLGTEGPAMVVDTACSSSLVAFHLALQALRLGEAELALAAGVNLLLAPETSVILSRAGLLAPDGRCKTFDVSANGYGRAEGCGVVVLKPLKRALADGDPILAVVKGSAVNHDGRSSGFTAPNGLAQEAVIKAALLDAGVEPASIGMIEAHGTGTALGDPIELDALARVFAGREPDLLVGSVKTNFGHAEAAAGIAGIIKAVLAVGRDTVPPHLHYRQRNPHAATTDTPITVPTAPQAWPVQPARAGISAFGASGTNAHVVIEAPPAAMEPLTLRGLGGVLLVSGATPEAVRTLGHCIYEYIVKRGVSFANACHSAAVGRARLEWWAMASSAEDLQHLQPSNVPVPPLPMTNGRRVALPTYPFARQRYWIDTSPRPALAILGPPQRIATTGLTIWTGRFSTDSPWIGDHVVQGVALLPATCFLAICVAAGMSALEDVAFLEKVEVPANGLDFQMLRTDAGKIQLFVENAGGWREAVTAVAGSSRQVDPLPMPPETAVDIDGERHLVELAERGFSFGPAFRRVQVLRCSGDLAMSRLGTSSIRADLTPDPALLDHALQTLVALLPEGQMWLPAGINDVQWTGSGIATSCRARLAHLDHHEARGDVQLLDDEGRCLASLQDLRLRHIARSDANWIHEVRWQPAEVAVRAVQPGWHVIDTEIGEVPADAVGVLDLRPLMAMSPISCLTQTARLVRELARRPRPPALQLVSRGAASAPPTLSGPPAAASILAGLVPTIAAEHPELDCRWLDLDPSEQGVPQGLLIAEQCAAIRGGMVYLPQIHRVAALPALPFQMVPGHGGLLDGLEFRAITLVPPGPGEIHVRIHATGLNFKDVLVALGQTEAMDLGLEAAGEVLAVGDGVDDLAPGERVILFAPGVLGTHVTLPAYRCIRCPPELTAAVAATIPIAFLTAWHGLIDKADIQPGERILVHAGAGGVGMATAQLATWRGAHVFSTVSAGKAGWARRSGAEETGSSRDTSFVEGFGSWSHGTGVDVVVHALSQATAEASAGLLKPNGRFIELGSANEPDLPPGSSYFRYDLEQPLALDRAWFLSRMTAILDLIKAGSIKPLVRTETGVEAAGEALAALGQGRTIGKTVLLWPQATIRGGTWLVTGGQGTVGLAIARWLASHGAGRVVLAGRTGRQLEGFDTLQLDVGDRAAVRRVLDGLGELSGIVHAAGVVDDETLLNLSEEAVAAVFRAKVDGAQNLHELTADRHLDAFVLVSSVVASTGAAGQGAYAAANAWLEGLVRARRASGLIAAAVGFGPWQGGMFDALPPAHQERLRQQGYRPMAPASAASAFGSVISSGVATRLIMDRHLAATVPREESYLRSRLHAASGAERVTMIATELMDRAVRLLGFPSGTRIDGHRALRDLGLDSLLAVSFRNELAETFELPLSASLAFDHPTIDALARYLDTLLFPPSDQLDGLDEDDLARMLAKELETSD